MEIQSWLNSLAVHSLSFLLGKMSPFGRRLYRKIDDLRKCILILKTRVIGTLSTPQVIMGITVQQMVMNANRGILEFRPPKHGPARFRDIAGVNWKVPHMHPYLDDLVQELNANFWIHGHVHHSADYFIGCTSVVCNPRGYPDEPNNEFRANFVVEL